MEDLNIQILIVDDEPTILKALSRSLKRRGYEVRTAESGARALEVMEDHEFQVVLLDQTMPGMSGMDTLEEMQQRFSDLPQVIMVTAADSRHLAVEFMKMEAAADFIPKPVNLEMLELQIRAALRTKEIREARDRERAARIAAEESDRMKNYFLANMGHELNTPLNVITGYAQLLQKDLGRLAQDEIHAHLTTILKSARLLALLTGDLLRATPNEISAKLGVQQVPIPRVLEDLSPRFREIALEKGLSFMMQVPDGLPPVLADRDKLCQVLEHLLDNALKFTAMGGVRLSAEHHDGFVRLDVRDTGMGIPAEHHEDIFRRFWRLDATGTYPGLGIGLYLVRYWTEKMNGRVGLESEPGKGALFQVAIPVWQNKSKSKKESEKQPEEQQT